MKNLRAFYSEDILTFLKQTKEEILGIIQNNDYVADTSILQRNAWSNQIDILKRELSSLSDGRLIFEYTIPRMGKRVDVVLLHNNIVFVLEFKNGDVVYHRSAIDQVYDYALDLQNFQKESHNKLLVPILVATDAHNHQITLKESNKIIAPLLCNSTNIFTAIQLVSQAFKEPPFDYLSWQNSQYLPTPTIVEAAQALYRGHQVDEITRSDASVENLSVTTDEINEIIEFSKANHRKSICFVTGVPGAGKTLVGLNLAIQRSESKKGEHAVFLSGNYPLVTVLQEALARDKVLHEKLLGNSIRKSEAHRSTSAFIQIIHKYRDSFVNNNDLPPERIVIFDEAQRAWTKKQMIKFMKTKKGIDKFSYSEPEFLISTMDRHKDWAVIVCLIGGGQEINTGEAGLPEWFDSLKRSFPEWEVYYTPHLNDHEYRHGRELPALLNGLRVFEKEKLHLSTSVRSFRTPDLSSFVKAIVDGNLSEAKKLYEIINDKYPIFLTRELSTAKEWVKNQSKGTTRYGMLASSGSIRLKPEGIFVKNEIKVENWFLNDKDDVRSCYMLEDVVTEFDIQGLELDYSIVAWDADFRIEEGEWAYYQFIGTRWNKVNSLEKRLYLKNAYRVLLTRARQGMIIFVPKGSDSDSTRNPKWYDEICNFLKESGIPELVNEDLFE